jgi:ABC-2 type transport system permease protein
VAQSIRKIASTEMALLLRDGVFRTAALFLAAAVLIGLAAGASHYHRQQGLNQQAAQREQARWLNQPPRDPHSATHFGQTAFHQLGLLSAFDSGVDPYAGVTVFLESHKRNFPRFPWSADAARLAGPGHFTAASAWRILLPLFIIVMAHGAISREREEGILGLLLASGVSQWNLLIGKFTGHMIAIAAVAAPLAILTAASLAFLSPLASDGDWFLRGLSLALFYSLYALIFLALSLAVSAALPSTAAARSVLLSFWVLSSLVVPRAITDLSQTAFATPSSIEVEQALNSDPDRFFGAKRREELTKTVLAKYGVQSTKDLPINFNGLLSQTAEEHTNGLIDRHFRLIQDAHRNGVRWIASWSWLSPALAMDGVSMALSGTDLAHYDHFLNSSEEHRRLMVRMLNEEQARHPVKAGERSFRADSSVWKTIPTFDQRYPDAAWSVRSNRTSFAALGIWFLLAIGVLVAAANRRWV